MGLRAFFVLLLAARTTRTTASGKGKSSAGSGAQIDTGAGSWQPSAQQLKRGVPRDDGDWFAAMAGELRKSLNDTRFGKRAMPQDAMNDMAHKVVKKYPTKESSKQGKGSDKADDDHSTAAEFTQFMKRVQLGDTRVSNSEVN